MNVNPKCLWYGRSDEAYKFTVFRIDYVFQEIGGNFIFCDQDALGDWSPFYVGETDNLFERLEDLELKRWIRQQGVSHIHARPNPKESDRAREKEDLVVRYSPPLNGLRLN